MTRRLVTWLSSIWRRAVRIARQLIGVPDYERYLEHLRRRHPKRDAPSYAEFFRERQVARYKSGGGRCC